MEWMKAGNLERIEGNECVDLVGRGVVSSYLEGAEGGGGRVER